MRKRLCSIFLIICAVFVLSGCGSLILYDEEKNVKAYVDQVTEGYTLLTDDPALGVYTLYDKKGELTVKLEKSSKSLPTLSLITGSNRETVTEKEILSIEAGTGSDTVLYGSGNTQKQYYDPYEGDYIPNMRVYRKDESNYRILFTVFNELADPGNEYYAFSEGVYDKIIQAIEQYNKDEKNSFHSTAEQKIDYLAEFKAMYLPYSANKELFNEQYQDVFDLQKLADNNVYLLAEKSEYYSFFTDTIFKDYVSYSVQDARKEYEKLGYRGFWPDMVIVPVDLAVSEGVAAVTQTQAPYYSAKALENGYEFRLTVCPAFQEGSP